jgi:hypothetical protein
MSKIREDALRKLLRLGPRPNPEGVVLTPSNNDNGNYNMEFLSEEQREVELSRWHAEGRRADLAAYLAYYPQSVRAAAWSLHSKYRYRKVLHQIETARTLTYRSYVICPREGCLDIDGYWDIGSGYPLDIFSTAWFIAAAQESWQSGEVFSPLPDFPRALVISATELGEENVRTALEIWYRNIFARRRGHWALSTGTMPKIIIDIEFLDASAYAKETAQP